MGCSGSKIEDKRQNECDGDYCEAISQCKQRKELLRQAAQARSAFAKANADYLEALLRTGSALQSYCRVACNEDLPDHHQQIQQQLTRFALEYVPMASQRVVLNLRRGPPCEQYLNGVLFKPPPPPPGCSAHWENDLLQEILDQETSGEEVQVNTTVSCKEVEDDDEEELDMVLEVEGDQVKCNNRSKCKQETKSRTSSCHSSASKEAQSSGSQEDARAPELSARVLGEIFRYVHQEFINASRSGASVGRMLESSNGTELGLLGASVKALTWRNEDEGATRVEDANLGWSQAVTLERLSAWELKLYEEVKALAMIHSQFNKKRKLLNKYGVNRVHDETMDKTRADTKAAETQMLVAIQATEATAAAIQKITNEELHFQFMELIHGLAGMWKKMEECHEHQRVAVLDLNISQDFLLAPANSTCGNLSGHRNGTRKLQTALVEWQTCMSTLVFAEKEYVRSITKWLNASVMRRGGEQSRKQLRLMHLAIPEIYYLSQEWEKCVDALQQKGIWKEAVQEFISMVSRVERYQTEELKVRKGVEMLVKDLNKKAAAVERKDSSGSVSCERRAAVEWLRQELDKERSEAEKLNKAWRACIASSIEKGLPKLFKGTCEIARLCFQTHEELHERAKLGIKQFTVVR